jgi:DNA transformation protein
VGPEDIRELFAAFGSVTVRRMFGGAGIYAEETMFALVHDGVIYLKADAHNAPASSAKTSRRSPTRPRTASAG